MKNEKFLLNASLQEVLLILEKFVCIFSIGTGRVLWENYQHGVMLKNINFLGMPFLTCVALAGPSAATALEIFF